jgi:PGF-pre-PGF domain-containing protein
VISTEDNKTVIAPPGTYDPETRTITWYVGEVEAHKGGFANFSVKVRNDVENGTIIYNYATVYFASVPQVLDTNIVYSIVYINETTQATNGTVTQPSATGTTSPVSIAIGGGGGGGAVFTSLPLEAPSEFKYTVSKTVSGGEEALFTLSEEAIEKTGVVYLTLKPEKRTTITLTVSKVKSLPDGIPLPPYDLYNLLEISVVKYGTQEKVKTEGKVKFRVSKQWLKENGYDRDSVILMKYAEKWIELPTTVVGEDENYVYFETEVKSFSIFAIVAKEKVKAKIIPTQQSPVITETIIPTSAVTTTPTSIETRSKTTVPGFQFVYTLVTLIAVVYVIRKLRN